MDKDALTLLVQLGLEIDGVSTLKSKLYSVAGHLQAGIDKGDFTKDLEPFAKWFNKQAYALTDFVKNLEDIPQLPTNSEPVAKAAPDPKAN